jgi:hypothetical protein
MVFYNDPIQSYAHSAKVKDVTLVLGGNYPYFYDTTIGG